MNNTRFKVGDTIVDICTLSLRTPKTIIDIKNDWYVCERTLYNVTCDYTIDDTLLKYTNLIKYLYF